MCGLLIACQSTASSNSQPAQTETPANLSATKPSVGPATQAFYRRAFPKAHAFVSKQIPSNLIRHEDRDNDSYLEVYDQTDALIGYLRDFQGPVTLKHQCECNPLDLTLAFNAKLEFKTIISGAPLQKYGHEPMTDEEFQQLLTLVAKPNPTLTNTPTIESVIDTTTGATRTEFQNLVVAKAALSTRRIAGLVLETQQAISGAPLSLAQQELGILMQKAGKDPKAAALALAGYLNQKRDIRVSVQVYQTMLDAYTVYLQSGQPVLNEIEDRLLYAGQGQDVDATLLSTACESMVRQQATSRFAEKCTQALQTMHQSGKAVDQGQMHVALGLHALTQKKWPDAEKYLGSVIHADPQRIIALDADMAAGYLRAASELTKRPERTCTDLELLTLHHPLYPGLDQFYQKTGCPKTLKSRAEIKRKQTLLAQQIPTAERKTVPKLSVQSSTEPLRFDAARPTVLVFFATWCPHCQRELPRIVNFVKTGAKQFGGKLDVIGVRTATERETEPYERFKERFGMNFTVHTDTQGSGAFRSFYESAGIPGGLPTLVVLDKQGRLAYVMQNGDHRDSSQELTWAIESLM